jgi:predicted DNA-binding transcriptional regulator AlpA
MDFDALSISDFCRRHGLCRATFYNLMKRGEAPATMKVGSRTLVSAEAAAAWRRRMEAGATQKAAA